MASKKTKVLMVCLGNICRSPIAEAVFMKCLEDKNKISEWDVDSAAIIGYHTGNRPDQRALNVLKNKNIEYNGRARPITKKDFEEFDYIFGMDHDNIHDLNKMKPKDFKNKILLLGEFGLPNDDNIIEDPYYLVGEEAFYKVYDQCVIACAAFIDQYYEQKV